MTENIKQLRTTMGILRTERTRLMEPIERLTRAINALEDIIDRDI